MTDTHIEIEDARSALNNNLHAALGRINGPKLADAIDKLIYSHILDIAAPVICDVAVLEDQVEIITEELSEIAKALRSIKRSVSKLQSVDRANAVGGPNGVG